MHNSDREIVCVSCGQSFVFTGAEQAFFAQHGFQEPRRCKPCRAQRKAQGANGGGGARSRRDRGGDAGGPSRIARGRSPGAHGIAAPDDPNGYRAPAFQTESRPAYAIDYAGLPRDDDDAGSEPNGNIRESGTDRLGMRAPMVGGPSRRGPRERNGAGFAGRDRSGTDANAYRSPAFAPPPRDPRPISTREAKKSRRMRHEATCADCGVAALVPFQPAPDRPAFCKACYQIRKANGTVPRPTAAPAGDDQPVRTNESDVTPRVDAASE